MSSISSIEWTDATWNIARGCTKVDADCKFCYMYRDSMKETRYNPKQVTKTKSVFNMPLKLKEPSKIFTSSLTDFFHEDIDSFRDEAWDIIRRCPQHTFQILTKRPERIKDHLPADWGNGWDNVWLGTSVGSEKGSYRMAQLAALRRQIPIKTIFVSIEPYYEQLNEASLLIMANFDWVIVGGESGNETGKYRYRPCEFEWIEIIVNDCKDYDIPVFVKQMGTYLSKRHGLGDRHGRDPQYWPEALRIREFPKSPISNPKSPSNV